MTDAITELRAILTKVERREGCQDFTVEYRQACRHMMTDIDARIAGLEAEQQAEPSDAEKAEKAEALAQVSDAITELRRLRKISREMTGGFRPVAGSRRHIDARCADALARCVNALQALVEQ